MLSEFREFIAKGNVMDLAVGVIIGAAFQKIVDSLVNDLVMPVVGFALGGTDFTSMFVILREGAKAPAPYASLAEAKAAGAAVFAYGVVHHPGRAVPDPGVDRVPDGEGREPDAAHFVAAWQDRLRG